MFFSEYLLFPSGGRSHYRIPSVIAAKNGTVLAVCNDRKDTLADTAQEVSLVYAVKSPGKPWSEIRTLTGIPGWDCWLGSTAYDESTNTVFVFGGRDPQNTDEYKIYSEDEKKAQEQYRKEESRRLGITIGGIVWKSENEGETWREEPFDSVLSVTEYTHFDGRILKTGGNTHGSAHGIQLKHGRYRGRLVVPSRFGVDDYESVSEIRFNSYNNCIFSDDHGKTWTAGGPAQIGTGEGAIIENADGSLTLNSRAYFGDGKRRLATSRDGGSSWEDFRIDETLIEDTFIGCNASLIRVEKEELNRSDLLPEGADGITVFCNPFSEKRENLTLNVSFDGGKTWAMRKTVHPDSSVYSSLVFSEKTQRFTLLYEKGTATEDIKYGITAVEFDLEWLLAAVDGAIMIAAI